MEKSPIKSVPTHIFMLIILLSHPLHLHAEEIVINVVGDIMLAGRWAPFIKQKGYDYPFDAVRKELAAGDINFANLESPIATGGHEYFWKNIVSGLNRRWQKPSSPPVSTW